MKNILYAVTAMVLLTSSINASKEDIKIISDPKIINVITKELPEKGKIKEFLKRIAKNPEAIKAIKEINHKESKIITYLTKAQLFTKLFVNKIKSISKKNNDDVTYAAKWALKKIKENKIASIIAITSTGLVITGGAIFSEEIMTGLYYADELRIYIIDSIIENLIEKHDKFLEFWEKNKYDLFPKEI